MEILIYPYLQDHDHPSSAASTYFQSQAKLIKMLTPTKKSASPAKKGSTSAKRKKTSTSSEEESELESDLDSDSEDSNQASSIHWSSSDNDNDGKKAKKPSKRPTEGAKVNSSATNNGGVKKEKKEKASSMPGELNPNYIRKRCKLVCFSKDSASLLLSLSFYMISGSGFYWM